MNQRVCSLAGVLLLAPMAALAQSPPMTNADVVHYVALHTPDRVLVTMINEAIDGNVARFDLSPSAVSDLAGHGVSPSTIAAMRRLPPPTPAQSLPKEIVAAPKAPTTRATPAIAALPPDPVGPGKWRVSTETNPLNDHVVVTAMINADGPIKGWLTTAIPTLVVRCQTPLSPSNVPAILPVQPGLEVYVVTGMPANVENAEGIHQLQVRFDDQPAQSWGASESTDKKALFIASIFATEIVVLKRTLATSKRMLVGFTPFNASPVIMAFDVRGFRTHMSRILAACPSVDQSAWMLPSAKR